MPFEDLRERPIEQLVEQVQALSAVASQGQMQSVAALAARLTIELASSVNQLSDVAFTAKRQLVERMDTLGSEIHNANVAMGKASEEAAKHTSGLVLWTKVLVVVTGIYTLATIGLLIATISQRP